MAGRPLGWGRNARILEPDSAQRVLEEDAPPWPSMRTPELAPWGCRPWSPAAYGAGRPVLASRRLQQEQIIPGGILDAEKTTERGVVGGVTIATPFASKSACVASALSTNHHNSIRL